MTSEDDARFARWRRAFGRGSRIEATAVFYDLFDELGLFLQLSFGVCELPHSSTACSCNNQRTN